MEASREAAVLAALRAVRRLIAELEHGIAERGQDGDAEAVRMAGLVVEARHHERLLADLARPAGALDEATMFLMRAGHVVRRGILAA
jgi:hypothetical protein